LPESLHNIHKAHRESYFKNPSPRLMGAGRDLHGRRKDGSQFQVEIGLSYTETAEGKLALAFITDITERQHIEQVLQEQQDFQSQVMQALEDIGEGLLISQDGKAVYANDAFLSLTGYTLKELTDLPSVVDLVVPEQRANLNDRVARRQRGEHVRSSQD